jgi:hypothetical protein
MCPHVVKELVNPSFCVHSRGQLLRGNDRQSHQYGEVDSTGIVEETSNNIFDTFFTTLVQEGNVVSRCRSLIVFTVRDGVRRVGTMLWFERRGMSITGCLFHDMF